jgi:AcrR family transcriptional regulator
MPTASRPTLRERRRADLALEISALAAERFARAGVAATTVAELAEAAGVSTRTFHRYFATKADALAPVLREGLTGYLAAVADTPATRHAPEALTAALVHALAGRFEGPTGAQDAERVRLVVEEPELLGVWLRMHEECVLGLVPLLAERLPRHLDPDDPRLRFVATLVVTANRLAVEEWATRGGDVRAVLQRFLRSLPPLTGD